MDGAGPFQNFFKITLPLLIKPLTPLMIASFAFNFNNFCADPAVNQRRPGSSWHDHASRLDRPARYPHLPYRF
ncbi:hypothetical protein ACLK1V_22140 [Escherichia coli]